MKYVVHKAYWDYEKEEKWLNEMAARGMALTDYSWCRYVFADAQNGEYIYRIELLNELPGHPESVAYLRFLEENGVEHVASYLRWVYLRKKASEGAFELYSDIESRIRHYKRVNLLWSALMWMELIAGSFNLLVSFEWYSKPHIGYSSISFTNLWMGIFLMGLAFLFWSLGSRMRRKIRQLGREKLVRE